jgi:hypothetical protein
VSVLGLPEGLPAANRGVLVVSGLLRDVGAGRDPGVRRDDGVATVREGLIKARGYSSSRACSGMSARAEIPAVPG